MIHITKLTRQTVSTKNDQIYSYLYIQITPPSIVSPWENISGHLRWAVCLSSVNTALCSQAVCLFRSSTLLLIHSEWKGQLSNPLRTPSLTLSFPLSQWLMGRKWEERETKNGHILRGFSISDKISAPVPSRKRHVLRLFLILCVRESVRPILHRGHTWFWWDTGACGYTPIGSNQTPNTCWASGINPAPSPWQWYSTLMGTIHYSGATTGCYSPPELACGMS